MRDSETFGVERGHGEKVVAWLNQQAQKQSIKLEARLYGYNVSTKNFGDFEMFSWIGDVQIARKLILRASKRFKVKVIEGGYKPKERMLTRKKIDLQGKTLTESEGLWDPSKSRREPWKFFQGSHGTLKKLQNFSLQQRRDP